MLFDVAHRDRIALASALAIAALLGSGPAPAREPPERHAESLRENALQADLGLAVVGVGYERLFGRHLAVQVEVHAFGTWFGPAFDLPHLSGIGSQIRPTVFLLGRAPEGLYVAPYLRGARVSGDLDGATGRGQGFSAGIFGGYSFVLGRAWNVRVGAGAQYMKYEVRAGSRAREIDTPFPALDLVGAYLF